MIGALTGKDVLVEYESHCVKQVLVERSEGGVVYRFLWFRLTIS